MTEESPAPSISSSSYYPPPPPPPSSSSFLQSSDEPPKKKAKSVRFNADANEVAYYEKDSDANERIDENDDNEDIGDGEVTPDMLKHMIMQLEKKINKNQEMRLKYSDRPEEFMDSELDLDDEIRKFNAISTTPALFADFVRLGATASFMSLLCHDNEDISSDVLRLFVEYTSVDDSTSLEEIRYAAMLVDDLLKNKAFELLTQNMTRASAKLSELLSSETSAAATAEAKVADPEDVRDKQEIIVNTLTCFDNCVEIAGAPVRKRLCEIDALPQFLLDKVLEYSRDLAELDDIGSYACELLSIVVNQDPEAQQRVGELDGIELLLQAVNNVKHVKKPKSPEDEEFIENIFNTLCSLLLDPKNQSRFTESEGINLMLIVIKEKGFTQKSALRTISFQLQNNPTGCTGFIEALGLKTLFPMLSKCLSDDKKKKKKDKAGDSKEFDENVVSCIQSLVRNVGKDKPELYTRLISKFTENNYDKINVLVALFCKYHDVIKSLGGGNDDDDEDLLDKFDMGLFTLQSVCVILATLAAEDEGIRKYLDALLSANSIEPRTVRDYVQEMSEQVGDGKEREYLQKVLNDSVIFKTQKLNDTDK